MTDEATLAERAHRRACAVLRRWLAETHSAVASGPIELTVGPVRLRTEVVYESPVGAHGFGDLHIVDSEGTLIEAAGPVTVAAACSAAARARATSNAPINSCSGSLVDYVLGSLNEWPEVFEDMWCPDDLAQAEKWWDQHVDSVLLPTLRESLHPAAEETTDAASSMLINQSLRVVGWLGRHGKDERELLTDLADRLEPATHSGDGLSEVVRRWLTSPTLTDFALLNGSGLHYRGGSGVLESPRPRYEVPNPLRHATGLDANESSVPGVPLPALEDGWSLRPVQDDSDVSVVHRWMNTEHVAVNWQQAWPWSQWRDELVGQRAGDRSLPCLVSKDGQEIAYLELYRVARDGLARTYPYHPHDLGVHIAIGEPAATGRGFGTALLKAVARGLLAADPACHRVVAEPNVHNAASIAAFRKAGYSVEREVGLPGKNSALVVYSRE